LTLCKAEELITELLCGKRVGSPLLTD